MVDPDNERGLSVVERAIDVRESVDEFLAWCERNWPGNLDLLAKGYLRDQTPAAPQAGRGEAPMPCDALPVNNDTGMGG